MGRRRGAVTRRDAVALAVCLALALAVFLFPLAALAYTASGDRVFVATGILPQIAPSDQFYTWGGTRPLSGSAVGAPSRATTFGGAYDKTITERLGIHF